MPDWSELYHDLLIEIAERITWYPDLITFGSICTSWEAAAMTVKFRFKSKIPWLMLAPKKFTSQREFFRQGQNLQITLSEANDKKCLSSQGWLMIISPDCSMNLLHPFSGVKIKLSHMKTFKDWRNWQTPRMYVTFIHKFLLSANPSSTSDYIVLVIYGGLGKLAYWRPGDEGWTTSKPWQYGYYDLTYFRGTFYTINTLGHINACHIPKVKEKSNSIVAKKVVELPINQQRSYIEHFYLLESVGSLLMVCREGERVNVTRSYKTNKFKVFEVDITTNQWRKIKNLDNRTLFLGHNSSFSIEVSNDSQLKPNHIYFTDDCCNVYWDTRMGGGRDMGIYNIQDKSIEPYFKGESRDKINPPMWVDINYPWINSELSFS